MSRNSSRSGTGSRLPFRLSTEVISLTVLAIALALTGGSSRADVELLLILRPVTVLCLMALLLTARHLEWKAIRVPLLLLGLFALTIAIQLIPLPPAMWESLGGRTAYVGVLDVIGGGDAWRPIAVAPDRAWNALVALLVPLTVLVGYASLSDEQRRGVLAALLALIILSAVFGVAQMAGGKESPLYYYEFIGRGMPDGFFANRNHQASLLALAPPLLRTWTLIPDPRVSSERTRNALALTVGALLLVVSLVTGSRSGLVLMCLGVVGAFVIHPQLPGRGLPARIRWLGSAGLVAGFAALVLLVVEVNRAVAVDRLFGVDIMNTETRVANTPTSIQIIRDTLPFGSGFGSFVPMFNSYEPDALLKPTYFNNAHNDLIELALTGGVPSLIVLGLFVTWWGWLTYRSFFTHHPSRSWRALQRSASLGIFILMAASMTDYPLRTPLMSAIFALLCCWLAHGGDAMPGPFRLRMTRKGTATDARLG